MSEKLNKASQIPTMSFETRFFIRLLDLTVSGLGLILLAPIFLVIGLLIKFTSSGPIFYRAARVGKNGHLFRLYKFRSMYVDADKRGPAITVHNDPRITPVGRFLRNSKLDELPQLINILRGEMSLIGPRPEDPKYVAIYTPEQCQVLSVRPGLTSRASVFYREEETHLQGDDWEETYKNQILPRKLTAELSYLEKRTFWTDLLLIIKTLMAITNGGQRMESMLALRNRHFFLLDILVLLFIPTIVLTLRLDGFSWWPQFGGALFFFTLVALVIKLSIFYGLGLYHRYWRYAGVNDLTLILVAVGLSTLVLSGLFIGFHDILGRYNLAMFRTVPVVDGMLTCLVTGGLRLGLRGFYHWRRQSVQALSGRRVLVVGAGEAGALVTREMQANPELDMEPVAFIDDDPAKVGTQIKGIPVLGTSNQIPRIVDEYQIQRIVVALPSAPFGRQREIMATCERTGITTHTLPGVYELLAGYKTISRLPKVDITRLLRREPIEIDQTEVTAALQGATVLITGAGGSIGSELCRQIARYQPAKVILLGHGENSIFEINLGLRLAFPKLNTEPVIADIRNEQQINWIVETYRPKVIFHAAAHKHVPFMQTNVLEAITNNVLGTRNVLRAAEKYDVERFVLISSDKAVKPTSIMGATKRMAELLVVAAAERSERAYMAVRFGNVLGSRGSVIPIFQQQIANGGPLTVTHPDMTRYFMTIPEAVQLVLQSSVLGRGREVFLLDMGQPVRIVDLAKDLIRLSGLEPERDISIVYSGIRPGEKLSEDLFLDGEDHQRTKHPKIFAANLESIVEAEALERMVVELLEMVQNVGTKSAVEQIHTFLLKFCYYIDEYQPEPSLALSKNDQAAEEVFAGSLYPQPTTPAA